MSSEFSIDLSVRWGDMDALAHVNHTCFFTYFEQARIAWWESVGIDMSCGIGPVLLTAEARFMKPLTYPADIMVKLYAHTPGRSSFLIDYDVEQLDKGIATGRTKIVWVDYQKGVSVELPPLMCEHIASH